MADAPRHPTDAPDSPDKPEPGRATRNVPPLVWVIAAILVVVAVVAAMQQRGTHVTPQGGTMPQAEDTSAVIPAAPPSGDAPATPAGTVTGASPNASN